MITHELYHLHRQRRMIKVRKPLFPPKWIRFLDKVAMGVAIIGPLSAVPQAYKIWVYQNASGVALSSWSIFFFCNILMLIYGIAHREKVMITMYILWMLMNGSIALGILLYG